MAALNAAARAVVSTTKATLTVNVRCSGYRKDGSMCNQLLFKGTIEAFEGRLEFKCVRCGKLTIFT